LSRELTKPILKCNSKEERGQNLQHEED